MNAQLDLYVVLDRSGSMAPLRSTVVKEVNRLVASVTSSDPLGEVTVIAFDASSPFEVLLDRHCSDGAPALLDEDYEPGGATPLFDAVASALRLASRNQRKAVDPRRVIVAIVTDGEDNASETTPVTILGKIHRRKAAGWEFLYLGVGDVFSDAARIGLEPGEVHPWSPTHAGTKAAFATLTATALRRHEPRRRRVR